MFTNLATSGSAFVGTTVATDLRYISDARPAARGAYHPSRKRSPAATTVLKAFCTVVCAVMVTSGIDRDMLFEKYDLRLWSYDDQLVLFTVFTIPSVAVLAAIYVTFRGVQGLRLAFGLKNYDPMMAS